MSHGDAVTDMPAGFGLIGHTELTPTAAMADEARRFYAVQFHPEVVHTAEGTQMLKNFLFHICECEGGWSMEIISTSLLPISGSRWAIIMSSALFPAVWTLLLPLSLSIKRLGTN